MSHPPSEIEKKKEYNFQIDCFIASERSDLCSKFLEGHAQLIKDFGIKKLTSANDQWCKQDSSYVLLVTDTDSGEIIAGARLDVRTPTSLLPLEEAILDFDKTIIPYTEQLMMEGVGEICGLWISKRYLGLGLAVILLRADLSLAIPNHVKTLLFLCSDNTINMLSNMGCIKEKSIGNNGTFYYPKLDLIATLLIIPNITELGRAKETDKIKILNLGNQPNQNCIEETPNCIANINYNLKI